MEKRKFEDKDETDYYDSLEFCADLVWNGEFVMENIIFRILTLILSCRVPGEAGGEPPKGGHCAGQR